MESRTRESIGQADIERLQVSIAKIKALEPFVQKILATSQSLFKQYVDILNKLNEYRKTLKTQVKDHIYGLLVAELSQQKEAEWEEAEKKETKEEQLFFALSKLSNASGYDSSDHQEFCETWNVSRPSDDYIVWSQMLKNLDSYLKEEHYAKITTDAINLMKKEDNKKKEHEIEIWTQKNLFILFEKYFCSKIDKETSTIDIENKGRVFRDAILKPLIRNFINPVMKEIKKEEYEIPEVCAAFNQHIYQMQRSRLPSSETESLLKGKAKEDEPPPEAILQIKPETQVIPHSRLKTFGMIMGGMLLGIGLIVAIIFSHGTVLAALPPIFKVGSVALSGSGGGLLGWVAKPMTGGIACSSRRTVDDRTQTQAYGSTYVKNLSSLLVSHENQEPRKAPEQVVSRIFPGVLWGVPQFTPQAPSAPPPVKALRL